MVLCIYMSPVLKGSCYCVFHLKNEQQRLSSAFTVKHAVLFGDFLDLHPPVADCYPGLCSLTAAEGRLM